MATTEEAVAKRFELMSSFFDERTRRLFAGVEALAHGYGGREMVARATKLSRTTVLNGMADVRTKRVPADLAGVRRKGSGNRPIETTQPGIHEALEGLVDPVTRGDPESPLRWTSKSTRALASELGTKGFSLTQHTVGKMLATLGYSLQATRKTLEGESHPDRDAQFRHINAEAEAFQARGQPVISVDTKKKELVGEFHNRGREWQPAGAPVFTNTHDFPHMGIGKAIPYGVYDLAANNALVSVGLDHDTPVFAVNSIRAWWSKMGSATYPKATELLVTADAGILPPGARRLLGPYPISALHLSSKSEALRSKYLARNVIYLLGLEDTCNKDLMSGCSDDSLDKTCEAMLQGDIASSVATIFGII